MNKIKIYFHQLIVPFCIIIVSIMGKWYHAIPNELVKHPMFHSCDSKSMDRNMGWSSLGSQSGLDGSRICPAQIVIAIWASPNSDRNLGWTDLRSVQIAIWALTYIQAYAYYAIMHPFQLSCFVPLRILHCGLQMASKLALFWPQLRMFSVLQK